MSEKKAYLGDSVYIDAWHDGFVLTTESDRGPSDMIFLEPKVMDRLIAFVKAQGAADDDPVIVGVLI